MSLTKEQKQLLNNFVLSFADNGASLKLFLNEEIGRLKKVVGGSLNLEEVRGDKEMLRKTEEVLSKMENYKTVEIDDDLISEVLKIQALAAEIND